MPVTSRPGSDIEEVLGKFPQLPLQVGYRPPHQYPGNSYHVLMAYRDAYETDAEHVFLIEDDVLIHPEFFDWHRVMHAERELGCSIAREESGPWSLCFLGGVFQAGNPPTDFAALPPRVFPEHAELLSRRCFPRRRLIVSRMGCLRGC